jgi:hypothetical protein
MNEKELSKQGVLYRLFIKCAKISLFNDCMLTTFFLDPLVTVETIRCGVSKREFFYPLTNESRGANAVNAGEGYCF